MTTIIKLDSGENPFGPSRMPSRPCDPCEVQHYPATKLRCVQLANITLSSQADTGRRRLTEFLGMLSGFLAPATTP
jgi:hypothetical protein